MPHSQCCILLHCWHHLQRAEPLRRVSRQIAAGHVQIAVAAEAAAFKIYSQASDPDEQVVWENAVLESGLPYDIKVLRFASFASLSNSFTTNKCCPAIPLADVRAGPSDQYHTSSMQVLSSWDSLDCKAGIAYGRQAQNWVACRFLAGMAR